MATIITTQASSVTVNGITYPFNTFSISPIGANNIIIKGIINPNLIIANESYQNFTLNGASFSSQAECLSALRGAGVFFLTSNENYKGIYANEAELNSSLPVGQSGWFAFVTSTNTYWFWDSTPGNWVNTGSATSPGVTLFNGRQGAVEPETGDYTVNMVTGAAPLNSPNLTGMPTVPDILDLNDFSTKIANTKFVKDLLFRSSQIVTVGGAGSEYENLNTAYAAGFRSFYVISNVTQNNFFFSEDVKIKLKENVTVAFTPTNSQAFRLVNQNLIKSATIIAEGGGATISCVSPITGMAFFSADTNSFINLNVLGNVNFDFSASTLRIDLINTNSRLNNFYQGGGKLMIRTPNNLACGISINATVITGSFFSEYFQFNGAGTSSGFLLVTGNKDVFVDKIGISGSYNPSFNLINVALNSTAIINSIFLNPDTQTNCLMQFSGSVNTLTNPLNCSVNATISSNNTILNNVNLGSGTLDINSRTNVKINNCSFGLLTNQNDTTLISNTTIGVKPVNKIADYLSWTWTIARSGFSTNILNSTTPQNFLQYFMTGTTPPTPTLVINDMQLKVTDFVFNATDPLSPILTFPSIDGEVEYTVRVTITGVYSGATGTIRVLPFDIQRVSDNSLVGSPKHIKDLNTNTITNEFIELTTRTLGLTDNFSVTGIRFLMIQNTGATLTLTSVQFYVSARVIKLN